NAQKEIVDFEWLYANQKAAALNGVDFSELTGSLMLDKSPRFIRNEIFADLVKTAETGQITIKEVFLDSADLKTWLKITATKHEDGLIVLTEEISEQKTAELELRKQELLL